MLWRNAPALLQVRLSDSPDWKDLEAGEIIRRVTSKVQPGSIALFHNAVLHTPEALPTIIQTLLQEGYTCVTLDKAKAGREIGML